MPEKLELNSWVLGENCKWARDGAEIPDENKPSDFYEKFDFKTFIYHVFSDGRKVKLICPKLMSLEPLYERTKFKVDGKFVSASLKKFPLFDEILLNTRSAKNVLVENECGAKSFILDDSLEHKFKGLDTIVTVNKNNLLEWIEDFINFHVKHHRAEAVLLFDNGSTAYTIEDLENLLSSTPLEAWQVVSVPFRWGPTLIDRSHQYQFLQCAVMNISRQSFLRSASAVLSIDIDELVRPGKLPVFEIARRSLLGMARFPGYWRYCKDSEGGTVRHRDHFMSFTKDKTCPHKYCYVPSSFAGRFPLDWHGFSITNSFARKLLHVITNSRICGFWHCFRVHTKWKGDRQMTSDGLITDREMIKSINEVWPEYFVDV